MSHANVVVLQYEKAARKLRRDHKDAEARAAELAASMKKMEAAHAEALKKSREESERLRARREDQRKLAEELTKELDEARAANDALIAERGALRKEMAEAAAAHKQEANRLRKSRSMEVKLERRRIEASMTSKCERHFAQILKHLRRRADYEQKRLLLAQASGTRDCLKMLRARKIVPVPEKILNVLDDQVKKFEGEATELKVEELPAETFLLSPLILPSLFVSPSPVTGVDQFGSFLGVSDFSGLLPKAPVEVPAEDPSEPPSKPSSEDQDLAPQPPEVLPEGAPGLPTEPAPEGQVAPAATLVDGDPLGGDLPEDVPVPQAEASVDPPPGVEEERVPEDEGVEILE